MAAIEPDYTRDDSLPPPVPGVYGPAGFFLFIEHRRNGVNIGEYWLDQGKDSTQYESKPGVVNIDVRAGDVLRYHPRRSRTHPFPVPPQSVVMETPEQTHASWSYGFTES